MIRAGGVEGQVQHITLRKVTLRDGYGVVHFVPNGSIGVVSNLTRNWSRALVDVTVAHTEDVDRVVATLRRLLDELAADPAWQAVIVEVPTVAGVQRFGESGVDIRVWVNTLPGRHADLERELRRRIKIGFGQAGIEFAVPERVVRVVGAPPGGDPARP